MSDPVLKAIIKFCSLFSNLDKNNDQNRIQELLRSYISNYTKDEFIDQFIYVYKFYINQQNSDIAKAPFKKTSLRAVKAIRLISTINEELLINEKYLLIILFLEIIRFKDKILPEEFDYIETIAISFNLNQKEFYNLKNFILKFWEDIPWKENFVIINNKRKYINSEFKHIYRENLEGNICVLHIKSTNSIWFYYDGSQQLFLNNKKINTRKIYAFSKGSAISSNKMGLKNIKFKSIYYTEVGIKLSDNPDFKKTTFDISDLEFKYANSPNGLKKFSFKSESYLLVGIIGPSGSGKSTLLNILNGTLNPSKGKVFINGVNLHKEKAKLKGIIGYVPQDDLLFEELTVYENLYFNAKLCFSDYTKAKINETVENILKELDLHDIKDLKVGNSVTKVISGGQRKRLNIGMELMREPAILFVDEPTSGLSSNDSLNLINTLREQTLQGKLVIINIHQPSSDIFKFIDQLIVLDDFGHVIYTGDTLESIVYFRTLSNQINPSKKECPSCGNVNPEIILEIIEEKTINEEGRYTFERKVKPEKWYKLFNENKKSEIKEIVTSKELPSVHFKIPNKFNQFLIFSKRNLLSKFSNTQYLLISLIEAPLLAIILGYFTKYNVGTANDPQAYIFSENVNIAAYILMGIIVSLFIGLLISAEDIIKDEKILIREKFLNLSRFSYINSKVVFLFLLTAIQTISFVLIGNYILEIKGLTFQYWLILFSTGCFANILGLTISANLKSVIAIYILIPFLIIPQILLSGTIVRFDKLHSSLTNKEYPPIIADFMPSRWAYEALAVSHFTDNKYEKNYYDVDKLDSDITYKLNFLIPKITSLLDEWETIIRTSADTNKISSIHKIIYRSLKTSFSEIPNIKSQIIEIENLSLNQRLNKFYKLLDFAKLFYSEYQNKISYKRDLITQNTIADYNNLETYIEFKSNYFNKAIENIVLKNDESVKLLIVDNRIIRLFEPVFITPTNSFGRTHFYSALKKVGRKYYSTIYFNTIIIWIISLMLYIILVFDLIKLFNISSVINFSKHLRFKLFRKV